MFSVPIRFSELSALKTTAFIAHKILKYNKKRGEPCWVRTSDLLIKSQLLYRLS